MTGSEISNFLRAQGAISVTELQMDGEYALPTRDWVLNQFGPAMRADMARLGVGRYLKETFDCDNFAFFNYTFAQICHARTAPNSGKGLAVGVWMYTVRNFGGGHAINFAIVLENGQPQLMFFEPQTQLEVQLLPEEKIGATYLV